MSEHECAITMCGDEGPLYPMCENGHHIHANCLQLIAESSYPHPPLCPMCRSSAVSTLSSSIAVPIELLSRTPFSLLGATVAVLVGKLQRGLNQYF